MFFRSPSLWKQGNAFSFDDRDYTTPTTAVNLRRSETTRAGLGRGEKGLTEEGWETGKIYHCHLLLCVLNNTILLILPVPRLLPWSAEVVLSGSFTLSLVRHHFIFSRCSLWKSFRFSISCRVTALLAVVRLGARDGRLPLSSLSDARPLLAENLTDHCSRCIFDRSPRLRGGLLFAEQAVSFGRRGVRFSCRPVRRADRDGDVSGRADTNVTSRRGSGTDTLSKRNGKKVMLRQNTSFRGRGIVYLKMCPSFLRHSTGLQRFPMPLGSSRKNMFFLKPQEGNAVLLKSVTKYGVAHRIG